MLRVILAAALLLAAVPAAAQNVTASFRDTPMRDVAATFAEISGTSIVLGAGAQGTVTAELRNQPWETALRAIVESQGLGMRHVAPGVLRIGTPAAVASNEAAAPLVTRVFRLSYLPAADAGRIFEGLRSERGSVAVSEHSNSVVVSDTAERVATFARLLGHTR